MNQLAKQGSNFSPGVGGGGGGGGGLALSPSLLMQSS